MTALRKGSRPFVCGVLVALVPVAAAASDAWRPMPRLALVNDDSADSLYYYCAVAPALVFRYGGFIYQAPVLADAVSNDTEKYFFETYRRYVNGRGGLKQLVAVGGVAAEDVAYARGYFGLGEDDTWEVRGSPPDVAGELSRDWASSEYVVVAPCVASPTIHDVESAANAASIAAYLNAPLFYAGPSGISPETISSIKLLGPSKAVIVEIDDVLPASVNIQIERSGVSVIRDLKSERDVVTYINDFTDPAPPVLCCFRGRRMAASAALAAARYGGFVLELPDDTLGESAAVWPEIEKENAKYEWSFPEDYVLPAAIRDAEEEVAESFYAWLEAMGGTDPNQLEYVITFAPAFGAGSVSYVFDRAIMGYTETPAERGAIPGRFVNSAPENLACFNLTSAYRALIFGNPRPRHVTFCGMAYLAVNEGSEMGYIRDNFGELHAVNEVLGYHGGGFDDPGVFSAFRDNGYEAVVHDGRKKGGGHHPLVPAEELVGIAEDLRSGGSFFYAACHGCDRGIAPFAVDDGVAANVPWGRADWPAGPSGLVDYHGPVFTWAQWDEACGNSAGLVAVFNACSVGAGYMNGVVTRHLGAASISSYAMVPFGRHSWFGICLVDRLVEHGYTIGEALSFATAQVSDIFPQRDNLPPIGVRYVLAGDPFMPYYKPTWRPPALADPGRDYGGHCPGGSGPLARDFAARAGERAVTLSWRAATNRAVAGWNIYRDEGPDAAAKPGGDSSGPIKINDALISGRTPFVYVDGGLENGEDYYYWLEAVEAGGRTRIHGPVAAVPEADYGKTTFALARNFPNPFRKATTIVFVVPGGPATLTVYDMRGAAVRRLWEGAAAGGHDITWDGCGDDGAPLPPGVYLYRLEAGDRTAVRKLVLLR
jgi:hypothetical protein